MSNPGGKGCLQRPTDQEKFAENFERIFGKKPSSAVILEQVGADCQHPNNCINPFCSCEVKHENK
jgi:hypothetical protein